MDLATEKGYLETLINLVFLIQQIYQGIWMADSAFKNIPYFSTEMIDFLNKEYKIRNLKQMIEFQKTEKFEKFLKQNGLSDKELIEVSECRIM